ncbi:hypothetical protein MSG28_009273 [Choristoneura fumiferana]|uniref:Uncharacterized protein n=1 Tax=Choristoneura fumiferana TaxID=7141 RepID=A0ACC0KWP8_CHOFU|nr:hypothetical protein MSG28_009273 [Choristoneura fumiferana]
MTDLLDTVIMTLGVLITMALLSCLCCICMKLSYILETADRKGIQIDIDKLDLKHASQPPQASEVCTVIIPDVVIVL